MAAPKKGPRLGGSPAHQKAMMSNLASELFVHGRIRTTQAKAKTLRPYAEKLITKAKQGDLHARRQVLSDLRDRDVVAYLFEDVAPRFADRNGGYTRILKLAPRKGDNAKMALIELVDRGTTSGEEVIEEQKEKRSRGLFGRLSRRRQPEPAFTGIGGEYDVDDLEDEDVEVEVAEAPEEIEEAPEPPSEDSPVDETPDVPKDTAEDKTQPDDPTVGDPADEVADEPDAGGATGKDAGA